MNSELKQRTTKSKKTVSCHFFYYFLVGSWFSTFHSLVHFIH